MHPKQVPVNHPKLDSHTAKESSCLPLPSSALNNDCEELMSKDPSSLDLGQDNFEV